MKLDFIDGTIHVPTDVFNPRFMLRIVSSWILNSISESMAQSVVFLGYAIDIWNELQS
jgi:hypothetical protein